MTPALEIKTKYRSSATVVITEPSFLQEKARYSCGNVQLTRIKYSIREAAQSGEDCSSRGFIDFKTPYSPSIESATPAQPPQSQKKIQKLKAGTDYVIKLRAEYSIGDAIESEELSFETAPYTGKIILYIACSIVS